MTTTIKSQAYNSWTIPNKKLAGIILNFIEKVKVGSLYFASYKDYNLQLADNGKVLILYGEIVQPIVSRNINYSGYDWYNHKRDVIKVFNIEEKKFRTVGTVAMKPIPYWFAEICAVLADKNPADSSWHKKVNPLMTKRDSIWSIFFIKE